jgi:selenocysteine lyase/cysteine desulfurase
MGTERTFGQRLRETRINAGLSQSELEDISGIPKARLSRYENGHVAPSIQTLARLAQALDVSEASLLGDDRVMGPFLTGGEMIRSVTLERTTWNEIPWRYEAGTPAIAEAVGLGAAVDYLTAIGMDAIEAHEHELTTYAYERLSGVEGVRIVGPGPEERGAAISFVFGDVHPHDVAQELDLLGICVRAGHHCTQPIMRRYGLPATTRASFYLYTIPEEVDRLVEGLHKVRKVLG